MVFSCVLCNGAHDEYLFTSYLCSKCKKVKHYISIYDDRVYEVLDSVLSRTKDKQDNKVKAEIQKEIENKKYNLRSEKKDKVDL